MVIGDPDWYKESWEYYDYIADFRYAKLPQDFCRPSYRIYGLGMSIAQYIDYLQWFGKSQPLIPNTFVSRPSSVYETKISYRKFKTSEWSSESRTVQEIVSEADLSGVEPLEDVAKVVYRRRLLAAETTRLAKQIRPQVESALRSVKEAMKGVQ